MLKIVETHREGGEKKMARRQSSGNEPAGREQMSDEIRRMARQLYEKRGCKPGSELADWLEAEKIIKKKYKM